MKRIKKNIYKERYFLEWCLYPCMLLEIHSLKINKPVARTHFRMYLQDRSPMFKHWNRTLNSFFACSQITGSMCLNMGYRFFIPFSLILRSEVLCVQTWEISSKFPFRLFVEVRSHMFNMEYRLSIPFSCVPSCSFLCV